MEHLIQFVTNLVHYYPPELVSLYLLLGLGVQIAKISSGQNVKVNFISIFIGIPLGILVGLIVIAIFPAYVSGVIYNKLAK